MAVTRRARIVALAAVAAFCCRMSDLTFTPRPGNEPPRSLRQLRPRGQVAAADIVRRQLVEQPAPVGPAAAGSINKLSAFLAAVLVAITPLEQAALAGTSEAIAGGTYGAIASVTASAVLCGSAAYFIAPMVVAPIFMPLVGMSALGGLVTGAAHGSDMKTPTAAKLSGALEGAAGGFVATFYLLVARR
eukprot:TRINITY_DN12618_c0_g1_i1.p1 TRINITY_DN12618_c0_g1~~TRINITY_DN12618_c0_g1_i1.p1  ORF type:complete len:189 (-),score=22.79 TRINITY_DN12618_c0_g1_i1:907-1473(-)